MAWLARVEQESFVGRLRVAQRHGRSARSGEQARERMSAERRALVAPVPKSERDFVRAVEGRYKPGSERAVEDLSSMELRAESFRAWHDSRAKGVIERFARVSKCRSEWIQAGCGGCGGLRAPQQIRCDAFVLCVHCRGVRARKLRAKFEKGRKRARAIAGQAGFMRGNRGRDAGGAFRERFVTLTAPHQRLPLGPGVHGPRRPAPELTLACERKAWRIFTGRLHSAMDRDFSHWADKAPVSKAVARVRAFEATTGSLGDGHPHIHVWMLSPYLPRVWLAHEWGAALVRAGAEGVPSRSRKDAIMEALRPFVRGREIVDRRGFATELRKLRSLLRTRRGVHGRPLREVYAPIVDVRKVETGPGKPGAGAELIKYMVKDAVRELDGELTFADPVLFARMYVAMMGLRMYQASRFMSLRVRGAGCACADCGAVAWSMRRIEPPKGLDPPAVGVIFIEATH